MIYARMVDNVVVEVFSPPGDATIADCFHEDIAAQFINVSAVDPAPQPGWTYNGTAFAPPAAPAVDMRPAAQAALDKSDVTIIRCYEHAVAVPVEWATYRAALRAIVAGGPTSTALPVQPAYPAGT